MNKICLFFISVFLVCGCQTDVGYQSSDKEHLTNVITKKVAIQLKNELGLIPSGFGGRTMHQVEMLCLAFDCHQPLDIETGRRLLIAAVEKFAAEVNANEAIRPYLGNYPFSPKNIEIRIFIQNRNSRDFEPEKLCVVKAIQGVLEYEIDDIKTNNFKTIYEETYEEALQKLNYSK